MFTGNKFTVSVLSALTLAILTACGGSSEEFDIEGNKWLGGKERAVKERRKHAELPAVSDKPAENAFFKDVEDPNGSKDPNKSVYRQEGNVVTVIDHGSGYKTIKYNQSGFIDSVCLGTGCEQNKEILEDLYRKQNDEIKALEANITANKEKISELEAELAKKVDEWTKIYPEKDYPGKVEEEKKSSVQYKGIEALKAKNSENIQKIAELEKQKNGQNITFNKGMGGTAWLGTRLNINSDKKSADNFAATDAGIVPITGYYDENGVARVQKGMVGSDFNGVTTFRDSSGEEIKDSYLRDPAATGWSYNTFGVFKEGNDIAYQSIGVKTPTNAQERETADESSDGGKEYLNKGYLPYYGRATYTGIGHAYHNDEQVTMNVKVDADFHDRHLNFETSNATTHDIELNSSTKEVVKHMTRARPDLDLKGAADWAADVADFRGKVHNVGGNLEGQLEGSFYGPKAAEVGGVYGLYGKDKEGKPVNYVGGFGAKRP